MLRRLKRIIGLAPQIEWRCGTSWNTDVFHALKAETGSLIARYQKGNLVWERDCARELHEFKYQCLEHLIEADSTDHALIPFPPSFADALDVKRKCLNEQAGEIERQRAIESLASETSQWWPSNWCFGINAMFAAKCLVLATLDDEHLAASAALCAENLIHYMSLTAACSEMHCHENIKADRFEPEEATDDGIVVRGVACPHMEDHAIEERAGRTIESVASTWRNKLTQELVEGITPS